MLEYGDDLNDKHKNAMDVAEQDILPWQDMRLVSLAYEEHFCTGNAVPIISWDLKIPKLPSPPSIPTIPIPNLALMLDLNLNIPTIPIPNVPKVPSLNVPEIKVPELPLPSLTLPSLPDLGLWFMLPNFAFPSLPKIPEFKMPEIPSLPNISLPQLPNLPLPPDVPDFCALVRKAKNEPDFPCDLAVSLTLPELDIELPQLALALDIPMPDLWDLYIRPEFPDLDLPPFPVIPDLGTSVGAGVTIFGPKGLFMALPFDGNYTSDMIADALIQYWNAQAVSGQLPFLTGGTLQWPLINIRPQLIMIIDDFAKQGSIADITKDEAKFSDFVEAIEAPMKTVPMIFTTPWGCPGMAFVN